MAKFIEFNNRLVNSEFIVSIYHNKYSVVLDMFSKEVFIEEFEKAEECQARLRQIKELLFEPEKFVSLTLEERKSQLRTKAAIYGA